MFNVLENVSLILSLGENHTSRIRLSAFPSGHFTYEAVVVSDGAVVYSDTDTDCSLS